MGKELVVKGIYAFVFLTSLISFSINADETKDVVTSIIKIHELKFALACGIIAWLWSIVGLLLEFSTELNLPHSIGKFKTNLWMGDCFVGLLTFCGSLAGAIKLNSNTCFSIGGQEMCVKFKTDELEASIAFLFLAMFGIAGNVAFRYFVLGSLTGASSSTPSEPTAQPTQDPPQNTEYDDSA